MSQPKTTKQNRHGRRQKSWPLLLFIGGGLLLISIAAIALLQPSQTTAAIEVTGAASLRVDKEKVDLGNVKLGRAVEVSFTLTNVGDQDLRFTQAPYVEVVEGC